MATLATSDLYWQGIEAKVYVFASNGIAATTTLIPTRSEITASTDVTKQISAMSGWSVEGAIIQAPSLGVAFPRQVPGRVTAAQSSINFYADKEGTDIRGALTRGSSYYVMICPSGDVTAYKASVFPVTVVSLTQPVSLDEKAAEIIVTFAITGLPAEDITLPATA